MDLVEACRSQASACGRLGSPMYADLLTRVADDVASGGAAAEVLREHEDTPGPSAVALRLMGSVHRLVLERRAGALGAWYPSVGGRWEPDSGWAAFRDLLEDQPDAVREWLDRPPQTNEVGRSAALIGGLLLLGALGEPLRVRLVELGASGGLNLLADRFRFCGEGIDLGPEDSPVVLDPAFTGPLPSAAWPQVVERLGCDVRPVDTSTTQGRLALTAYVWADQTQRHERLRGALALAQREPVTVRACSAAELVGDLDLREGTTTVLWHSVMWQYLDAGEQHQVRSSIDALGARATSRAPFAHLFLEPTRRTPQSPHENLVVLETWPDGVRRVLGTAPAHGLPVSWEV